MNISIIGFGYIGTVIGAVLADLGHTINAVDSNQANIESLNQGKSSIPEPELNHLIQKGVKRGLISGSSEYQSICYSDAVLVTVGTPLSENFDADLSAIRNVFENLARYVRPGQIIMVKSTVPPGVTRQMADDFFNGREDVYIGFSPERLAEGNAISELKSLPIIVGGVNEISSEKCAKFWQDTLGVEVIQVSSCETAEMVKLANNQWIDLNIALANEFAQLCDALPYDLDVLEVIKGANSLKKGQHFVNILTPSIGVGGYCLTKDPWFLNALGEASGAQLTLPKAGRQANDLMPNYAANFIQKFFLNKKISNSSVKVAIFGYSFKTNSGDVRFSPMEKFVYWLFEAGFDNISIFDSTIKNTDINDERVIKENSWRACILEADCVVFGAAHDDIRDIEICEMVKLMKPNGLIYDGRRYFSHDEIRQLTKLGMVYQGIGRS